MARRIKTSKVKRQEARSLALFDFRHAGSIKK
jgi:hypothetical protein